jgi:hypothetical protein
MEVISMEKLYEERASMKQVALSVCGTEGHEIHRFEDGTKETFCLKCGMTLEEIRGELNAR